MAIYGVCLNIGCQNLEFQGVWHDASRHAKDIQEFVSWLSGENLKKKKMKKKAKETSESVNPVTESAAFFFVAASQIKEKMLKSVETAGGWSPNLPSSETARRIFFTFEEEQDAKICFTLHRASDDLKML